MVIFSRCVIGILIENAWTEEVDFATHFFAFLELYTVMVDFFIIKLRDFSLLRSLTENPH